MVTDIEAMIMHFSWPTVESLTEGMEDLRRFVLVDMPPAVVNCVETPMDFIKLFEFFSIFANATELTRRVTYNFIWYYGQIMNHFSQASNFWDQGELFKCGTALG